MLHLVTIALVSQQSTPPLIKRYILFAQKLSVITLKCILQIVMITAKHKIWHLNVNFIAKISLYFEARCCVLFVSADLRGPKHTNMSIFRFLLISFFKSNYVLDKTVYYNIEKHFLKRFENRK